MFYFSLFKRSVKFVSNRLPELSISRVMRADQSTLRQSINKYHPLVIPGAMDEAVSFNNDQIFTAISLNSCFKATYEQNIVLDKTERSNFKNKPHLPIDDLFVIFFYYYKVYSLFPHYYHNYFSERLNIINTLLNNSDSISLIKNDNNQLFAFTDSVCRLRETGCDLVFNLMDCLANKQQSEIPMYSTDIPQVTNQKEGILICLDDDYFIKQRQNVLIWCLDSLLTLYDVHNVDFLTSISLNRLSTLLNSCVLADRKDYIEWLYPHLFDYLENTCDMTNKLCLSIMRFINKRESSLILDSSSLYHSEEFLNIFIEKCCYLFNFTNIESISEYFKLLRLNKIVLNIVNLDYIVSNLNKSLPSDVLENILMGLATCHTILSKNHLLILKDNIGLNMLSEKAYGALYYLSLPCGNIIEKKEGGNYKKLSDKFITSNFIDEGFNDRQNVYLSQLPYKTHYLPGNVNLFDTLSTNNLLYSNVEFITTEEVVVENTRQRINWS